jgi:integrase
MNVDLLESTVSIYLLYVSHIYRHFIGISPIRFRPFLFRSDKQYANAIRKNQNRLKKDCEMTNKRPEVRLEKPNEKMSAWIARYTDPSGKRIQRRFPHGQRLAAQKWLEHELDLKDKFYNDPTENPWVPWSVRLEESANGRARANITFHEYAADFLENYHTKDGKQVREGTMRKKRESLRLLNATFGKMKIGEIDADCVNDWLDHYEFPGESGNVKYRAYNLLNQIFRNATAPGAHGRKPLIEFNPCMRKNPKTRRSKQSQIPPVTPAQLNVLYHAMPSTTRISILLMGVCGLRISEVCSLRLDDVDLDRDVIHIRHGLSRGENDKGSVFVIDQTKNENSTRLHYIGVRMNSLLKEHIAKLLIDREIDDETMLMPSVHNTVMNPNTLWGQFDKARKEASRPDIHRHTLRATAITQAAREASKVGATLRDVEIFGGHLESLGTSERYYQRASEEGVQRNLAEAVEKALLSPERSADHTVESTLTIQQHKQTEQLDEEDKEPPTPAKILLAVLSKKTDLERQKAAIEKQLRLFAPVVDRARERAEAEGRRASLPASDKTPGEEDMELSL